MSRDRIQASFERCREAFNRLDGNAEADLCGWPDDAPMRANPHALCAVYCANGLARADCPIEQQVAMGRDHAFARLRWTLTRADGSLLQRFATGYNLLRTAQGLRVLLCTAFEENRQEMTPDAAQ